MRLIRERDKRVITWPTASNVFITSKDPVIPEIKEKTPFMNVFIGMIGIVAHGMTKVVEFNHTRTGSFTYASPEIIPTNITGNLTASTVPENNEPANFFMIYTNNSLSSRTSMTKNNFLLPNNGYK